MANSKVYIVETPVKNFCGVGAGGVQFAYGKAEVHEGWVLNWYKEHGYKVTEKATDIDKMTVEQLKEYATANNIDLGDATKKAEILDIIKNQQ
jgi:hypothetical protein